MAYTIGITSPSGDGASTGDIETCWVTVFTSGAAGTMVQGTVCFDAGTSAGTQARFVVFSDVAGEPTTLLAVSSAVSVPAGASVTAFTLGGEAVAASTPYWIGIVSDTSGAAMNYTLGAGYKVRRATAFNFTSPPSTWPGSASSYADVAESFALEIEDVVAGPTMGYLRPNRLRPRIFGPGIAR